MKKIKPTLILVFTSICYLISVIAHCDPISNTKGTTSPLFKAQRFDMTVIDTLTEQDFQCSNRSILDASFRKIIKEFTRLSLLKGVRNQIKTISMNEGWKAILKKDWIGGRMKNGLWTFLMTARSLKQLRDSQKWVGRKDVFVPVGREGVRFDKKVMRYHELEQAIKRNKNGQGITKILKSVMDAPSTRTQTNLFPWQRRDLLVAAKNKAAELGQEYLRVVVAFIQAAKENHRYDWIFERAPQPPNRRPLYNHSELYASSKCVELSRQQPVYSSPAVVLYSAQSFGSLHPSNYYSSILQPLQPLPLSEAQQKNKYIEKVSKMIERREYGPAADHRQIFVDFYKAVSQGLENDYYVSTRKKIQLYDYLNAQFLGISELMTNQSIPDPRSYYNVPGF